nr:MAG TPA: hypothetical protein [Caudoviricetes sp.]
MRKIYEDGRGWRYAVRETLRANTFKAFYRKAGKKSFHACRQFGLRDSAEEAQAELDAYAAAHGWKDVSDKEGASGC